MRPISRRAALRCCAHATAAKPRHSRRLCHARKQGGQLTPIDLIVETEYHRAAPGGTGGTKCVGNYSPVLKTQLAAKAVGFSDVVYLDAKENKYIEEVSSCNIFVVKGKTIATPALGCARTRLCCRTALLTLYVAWRCRLRRLR